MPPSMPSTTGLVELVPPLELLIPMPPMVVMRHTFRCTRSGTLPRLELLPHQSPPLGSPVRHHLLLLVRLLLLHLHRPAPPLLLRLAHQVVVVTAQ